MAQTRAVHRHGPPDEQKEMQMVFKVSLTSSRHDKPVKVIDNVFRGRRSHRKSRLGCRQCKLRRIKCDEAKEGGCLKCRSRGVECDFNQIPFQQTTYLLLPKERTTVDVSVKSTTSPRSSDIEQSYKPLANPPHSPLSTMLMFPIETELPNSMTPILQTLHHFDSTTYLSMGSEMGQKIVRSCVYTIAIETPYLMHALHGVAATHLSHLIPVSRHPVQHNRNKVAAAYHWQKCLQLFREELEAGPTRQNMDALISTVMLISTHQFMLPDSESEPSKSFVYASAHQREACLSWLFINSGFTALWRTLGENVAQSSWMPVLQDADIQKLKSPSHLWTPGDETHSILLELCEIDVFSTPDANPYYTPLENLLFLRQLKSDGNFFNKAVNFLGGIDSRYHRLLIARDKRALIILAHWLALMAEMQQWWLSGRCKAECLAITTFLMHDGDVRVLRLLGYPARIAGMIPSEIPSIVLE